MIEFLLEVQIVENSFHEDQCPFAEIKAGPQLALIRGRPVVVLVTLKGVLDAQSAEARIHL